MTALADGVRLARLSLQTVLLVVVYVGGLLLEDGADEGGAAAHGELVSVRVRRQWTFLAFKRARGFLYLCWI